VTFEASFPSDDEWDDSGSLLVPGGKGILTHLIKGLEQKEIRCSEPEQQNYLGWATEAAYSDIYLWCLLQFADPWVLAMEVRWSLARWIFRQKHEQEHQLFLQSINDILKSSSHFSSIQWFTKHEFQSVPTPAGSLMP
jgi:hypothetical protein